MSLIQSSDIALQFSRCSTRRILYAKSHKVREVIQFLTDSHQTLLGKFLDVVQEEILYVKKSQCKGDNSVCH